jgi:hypothetical protein
MLINVSTKIGCQKSFGRWAWLTFVFQGVFIVVFIVLYMQKQAFEDVNEHVGQDAA